MKTKTISKLALGLLAALSFSAMAQENPWMVRARATHLNWDNGQSGAAQSLDVNAKNKTIPEVDISYFFTKNIAAELILAVGTKHDVSVSGTGGAVAHDLGKVNLLPPTLTAQWHFNPDQTIDPYVGAGAALVFALDRKLTADATGSDLGTHPIRIDRSAFGGVLQAGFDVNLQDKWLINFDVKKIWVNTDVKLDLANTGYKKIDNLDLNPLVVSVGIGKKF